MTADHKINYKDIKELASIRCNLEEIAAKINLPLSTVRRIAGNDPLFRAAMEEGQAKSRVGLRRLQWRHATGFGPAAVAMTIHLSKHWLGETDRSTIEVEGTIRVEGAGSSAIDRLLQGIKSDLLSSNEVIELECLSEAVEDRGIMRLTDRERLRFFDLVEKSSESPGIEPEEIIDAEVKEAPTLLALPSPSMFNRSV
jgi:hypothetical protein